MTFWVNIALFAVVQGLILGMALLFFKRSESLANVYLSLLIILMSAWIAEFASYFGHFFYKYPHALFVTIGLPLLFGPLLLFYVRALKKQQVFSWNKNWPHFIPFLLHTIYYIPFFIEPSHVKLNAIRALQNMSEPPEFSLSFFINEGLKWLQLTLYIYFVHRMVSGTRSHAHGYKFVENWVKYLVFGMTLFAVFDFIHFTSIALFQYDYLFQIAKGLLSFGAIMIYAIGYAALWRPQTLAGVKIQNGKKYEKSSLTSEKANSLKLALDELMQGQRPYLNPDLNLSGLAEQMNISAHHLSELLNVHMNTSFHELINESRVEAAKKMLEDGSFDNRTILSIGYEAGFRSKASFNASFKKRTGQTPSAYKKAYFVEE